MMAGRISWRLSRCKLSVMSRREKVPLGVTNDEAGDAKRSSTDRRY